MTKIRCLKSILLCTLLYNSSPVLYAQDSTKNLRRITLRSTRSRWQPNTVFPSFKLGAEEIRQTNSTSVADLAKLFPGTLVKDYGGIGGLKTISVRSLGGQHSAVLYDGIAISDMQGGQVDLGKISSDFIQSISLSHAQPADMLLPARAFASANALIIRSGTGEESGPQLFRLLASVRSGSFGFVQPSFTAWHRLSAKVSHRLHAEYQRADGRYPFESYDVPGQKEKRNNSDASANRLEYDLSAWFRDSSQLRLKAVQYYSDRGLPGSVIFFNSLSRQRLTDRDHFIQATWRKPVSSQFQTLVSAKYSHGFKRYIDPDFLNTRGYLENRFREQEFYGSVAATWQPVGIMSLSLASDYFHTRLTRSGEFIGDSSNPARNSWLSHLGMTLRLNRVTIQSGLLSTLISDKIARVAKAKDIQRLSPTVGFQYQPFDSLPLRFHFFYKEIFRVPTFNDLYYTFVGNVSLRPELVRQFNLGIQYEQQTNGWLQSFQVSADVYSNRVRDKIMAVPRLNLFQWSMMNVGKASIRGIDLSLILLARKRKAWDWSARLAYGYQHTQDISLPGSTTYKNPLPYAAPHSGSIACLFRYRDFSLSIHSVFSSDRYRPGDPIPENRVGGWSTQDIRVGWKHQTGIRSNHELFVECNNLLNRQYEVIRFYPMPGINYRIGYIIRLQSKQSS